MTNPRKMISLKRVLDLIDKGKTTVYRKMAKGQFPLPVRDGGDNNRWFEDEIIEYIESMPRVVSLGPKPDVDPPTEPENGAASRPATLPDEQSAAA